ncbi:hypothetical protein P0082_01940 [Candidatus Haliotispira prima]|uniref:Uncharacterized protein n=1 Tax=Candidatus Haliotispira prima TaxID=3034016 RepID=A0ABY8MI91_9SPIO|nr:hypothetical protein P0082_01940 [Candidatus Haliotispira prima]
MPNKLVQRKEPGNLSNTAHTAETNANATGKFGVTNRAGRGHTGAFRGPDPSWQLLQHDLQTQLNASLVRLDSDITQRLGQHTTRKLLNNGFDLLRSSRETLQQLVEQIHTALGPDGDQNGDPSGLEFRWRFGNYRNPDRPLYVEDGYICLHLPERVILRHFLQQKHTYKIMLDLLTDHVTRYVEKVYYRIEQHWQEFRSLYTVKDDNPHPEGTSPNYSPGMAQDRIENTTQDMAQDMMMETEPPGATIPSHNIANTLLDRQDALYPTPEFHVSGSGEPLHDDTASQIAGRHRRIQQLQAIARGFWQDNFAEALRQLQADLPDRYGLNRADPAAGHSPRRAQIPFDTYYIPILNELEQHCNLPQQRQSLLQRLRKTLEQSLETNDFLVPVPAQNPQDFPQENFQTSPPIFSQNGTLQKKGTRATGSAAGTPAVKFAEAEYCEYPESRGSGYDLSNLGAGDLPDELARLTLRYATAAWLHRRESLHEEQFIAMSQRIQHFFSEVEKNTRFRWFHAGSLLLNRKLAETGQAHTPNSGSKPTTSVKALMTTDLPAPEELLRPFSPAPVDSDSGAGQRYGLPRQQNRHYEAKLLLELLQKAGVALQHRFRFRTGGHKYHKLREEMLLLRRDFLSLCHQPLYTDVGIQIAAHYRTVRNRRETYLRLEKILQEFLANNQAAG